jgi:hypothetical protein
MLRNANRLREFLKKLGLKSPPFEMRYGSWLHKLKQNIDKKNATKELKAYEQEIKDRKTKQRS